jgi:hypothetical protein
MSLLGVVLTLVVVGVLLWLLNNYVPMDSKIKSIANVVVAKGRGVGREKESVMLWTVAGGRSGWVLRIRAAGWSMSCS